MVVFFLSFFDEFGDNEENIQGIVFGVYLILKVVFLYGYKNSMWESCFENGIIYLVFLCDLLFIK